MRERAEYEIGLVERGIFSCDESHVAPAYAQCLSPLAVCRRERQLEQGVTLYEKTKLAPGVSTGTQYSNRNFMH